LLMCCNDKLAMIIIPPKLFHIVFAD